MLPALGMRFLSTCDWRLLPAFVGRFGWGGWRSLLRHRRRKRKGILFPPFLFLSITNRCNLRCQGCWVSVDQPPRDLPRKEMDHIVRSARRMGNRFFGLLGGEPLLHPDLWAFLKRHRDCYFQLFTNGTLLTVENARDMRRLGNVTPLISLEGSPTVSDERRGGQDVHARTFAGVEHCVGEGLITGVATSLCRSNIDDLLSERYLDDLIDAGVLYAWYYIYRPAGPRPCVELALSEEQIRRVRQFLVTMRERKPLLLVDSYWDEQGRALCPAGLGISHHINPWGQVEPCPPIQFACDALGQRTLPELMTESAFLHSFRSLVHETTRGCILLEDPQRLARFVQEQHASDSSGRGSAMAELQALPPLPCHHQPGREIPEKHWAYRLAKRNWFFGFGAYG